MAKGNTSGLKRTDCENQIGKRVRKNKICEFHSSRILLLAERVGPLSTVDKPEQTSIRLAEPVLVLFSMAGFPWTQLLPKASISFLEAPLSK